VVGPPADTMNYRASSPPATTGWYVEDLFSVVTGSRGARVLAQYSLDKAASPAAAGGVPDEQDDMLPALQQW
jgi:hypothetical protein